jgi:ubiquinone/menaquinone biosynthesis C-methylase UbiE
MVCHGGFLLDEATRRSWYNPEQILKEAGVSEGAVFVDVGCGDGFFSLLVAKTVGETGEVYAVDTDGEAINRLKRSAAERGLRNIHTRVAAAEETVFCKGCADAVFYSMVLHDFNNPANVLQNAHTMLKPSGRLVDLDWKKLEMPFGPPLQIRFSEQKASELVKQAGFQVDIVKEAGRYHYLIVAKPSKP